MGKLEELEKKIKATWKSSISLSVKISDEEMTKVIHDVYLENLEKLSISFQPTVYFLDTESNKKYARKRTIILSISALVEARIDDLIRVRLDKNFPLAQPPSNNITQTINFIINELRYRQKVDLLEVLYKDEKINSRFLSALGRIRNAFAHSLFISDKKYEYEKKNINYNLNVLDNLVDKALEISDELYAISKKQPEYLEFDKRIKERIKNIKNS